MTNHFLRAGVIIATLAALTACNSARFGGGGPVAPRTGAMFSQPAPLSPGMAAPSGVVLAEPLAPIEGTGQFEQLPTVTGGNIADVPGVGRQASVSASTPSRPSRTNFVGSWRATESGGSSCRVTLSSTPVLDLYRASTSGCSNQDISRVNTWDLRGNEVYLYQQGGAVAARLQATPGSMSGVLSRSGAPVTMSR
jgi:hypothetical protein